ncbi:MAG TPA: MFS transporter [Candidatus Limnocylindria bacterium]|nr:MFS transporter [Candidatus Limnocylindria bacterium]
MIRLSIALFLVQAGFHGFTASIPVALARAGRPDAEIGALVGIAALVQIGGALAGGALIDRFGQMRLFITGGVLYVVAAAILLLFGLDATPAVVAARILQGAAGGLTVPASMAIVPSLVPAARRGTAIAAVGSAHNLTLVLLPPLSIFLLDLYGMSGVCIAVAMFVIAALAIVVARPIGRGAATTSNLAAATRHFGFAFRRSWLAPLAVVMLFVLHWGVVTAYLPQRAEAAGADIALFFAADGVGVLAIRIPAGWLADRIAPVWPVVGGIVMTLLAVLLLFDPPTTPVLMVAGLLTGVGAALIVQPLLLAMTARSGDADRGSAFALFNASFSTSIALGSLGTAPLIGGVGYATLLAVALGALALSVVVAFLDTDLRRPANLADDSAEAVELAGEANAVGP